MNSERLLTGTMIFLVVALAGTFGWLIYLGDY